MEQTGQAIMANSVATGAVLGMLGVATDVLESIFHDLFKKDDVVAANMRAAHAGYAYAQGIASAAASSLQTPLAPRC